MNPLYIFEAFCELPSVLLEAFVEGIHKIITVERDVLVNGDFDQEEIAWEQEHGILT